MSSLGSRLTSWYVLIITGTVAAVLLAGRIFLEIELDRGIDLLNATAFQEVENRFGKDIGARPVEALEQDIAQHSRLEAQLYSFQLRDVDGKVLFRSENLGEVVFPDDPEIQNQTYIAAGRTFRIAAYPLGPYRIQIGTSAKTTERFFEYYYEISGIMLAVVGGSSFYFGHQLSRLALNPIRRIQKAASRISAENLEERIPVSGVKDEISDLTVLLNQMFDRLEKAFGRLSRFAAEASHELKTPLSIIRLQSEKLLRQANLSVAQQEAVQQQLESINGLNLVIEKLLFIARTEVGDIRPQLKRQSTKAFINAFVEDALVLCEDRGIKFVVARNDEASASFDPSLLRQVLLNLLSNAIKVNSPKPCITLTSTTDAGAWKVVVEDTGPGLATNRDAEEMFKAFVRLDPKVEGSFVAGSGLGLAICRSILDLHHGKIRAENRMPESGLRVVFELPLGQG